MRGLGVKFVIFLLLSWPAHAQPISCEETNVTVIASKAEDARLTCDAAARAKALFAGCNIPPLSRPVKIELIEESSDCFGLFHCGEDWIEVLSPSAMAARRRDDSFFASVPINRFFQSIVVHELTHAAMDYAPCPFASCLVGNEYVAYVMQIMSLTPGHRRRLEGRTDLVGRRISRDELTSTMYFMAPDRFAVKAWMHFTQRDDPCGFLGQVVDGTVMLDRERFE